MRAELGGQTFIEKRPKTYGIVAALGLAILGLVLSMSCGTSAYPPAAEDHGGWFGGGFDGQPCVDGRRYRCGVTLSRHDGVVDCMEGTALCKDGALEGCDADGPITTKSVPPSWDSNELLLAPLALGALPVTCASNPCNPYCRTYVDSPKDSLDGGCGLTYDDAGAIVLGGTPCTSSGSDGGTDAGASDGGAPPSSTCGPYQIECGGVCVTPKVDPNNCGSCGNVCAAARFCSAGVCSTSCQESLTACNRACVNVKNDNNNCGSCGNVCPAGKGCNYGVCETAISVSAPPVKCVKGGPPIQIASTSGPIDCAGNLAQKTFQRAVCSCSDFTITAAPLKTDGFDSRLGPYAPGGLGAGWGVNGEVTANAKLDIGGEAAFGGPVKVNAGGGQLLVAEGLKASSTIFVSTAGSVSNVVTGDAYVKDNWTKSAITKINVTGNYYRPSGKTVAPTVGGTIINDPVNLPPPCPCNASDLVPAAAIVSAHATDNDNALIGLASNALASGGRLDLPCGHYYLTSIVSSTNDTTIVTHGHTALYIAGNLTGASTNLTIAPDPTSNLDLFIAGNITLNFGNVLLGNANYPVQMRVYAGGSEAKFGASSATNYVAANVDARKAATTFFGGNFYGFGSLYAASIGQAAGGGITVHHDRAIRNVSNICKVDVVPATFSRVFEAQCISGERVRWGLFTYDTSDPSGTNVTFKAKTAATKSALATASPAGLAVAGFSPVGSTTVADPQVCTGACAIDLSTKVVPYNLAYLQLDATLNPSGASSPALRGWNVTYSCIPAE